MKNEIINNVTKLFFNTSYQLKKHSPEILMSVGIIGTVVGTVLACKATTKVNEIIETNNEEIKKVHLCLEDSSIEYTQQDSQKDLAIIYGQTGLKLFKLYAPAAGIMLLSITSIVAGQKILKKRNFAIAAAYTIVDKGFKKYRENVIEKFGEEVDKELKYNIKKKEIEIQDKNGKKKQQVIEYIDKDGISKYSEYARFFDNGNDGWEKDSEYNLMFLRRQQDYANEMLKSRGHLFLNEVYDLLDIPRSKAGQVVGWVYNKNDNTKGDNYVDFNIYDVTDNAKRRFVNGYEKSILLDFNVDGVIYDII